MNKETYEALKKTMHHCEYGGANDKEFWDHFKIVEGWINEVSKEYTEVEVKLPVTCCNHKDGSLCVKCADIPLI